MTNEIITALITALPEVSFPYVARLVQDHLGLIFQTVKSLKVIF